MYHAFTLKSEGHMKFVINSLSDVAEPLRGEYEERNGRFYLKTEGDYEPLVQANTKLAEFRDNNRGLNTEVTNLKKRVAEFDGIDPVEHTKLVAKVKELEVRGVKGSEDIAALIKEAVKTAVDPVEAKLKAKDESEAKAQELLRKKELETGLRDVGAKIGIADNAMSDFIERGTKVFKNVDGKVVARDSQDRPIFSKKNVTEEISMEEWGTGLQTDASHLFRTSRGGGANNVGNNQQVPKRQIEPDVVEFGKNIEAIAKGEVIVTGI